MRKEAQALLHQGAFIPAMPLVLKEDRSFDERGQRRLIRYYLESGADGIAVGVHSTQFAIRDPQIGLFEPVLRCAQEEIAAYFVKDDTAVESWNEGFGGITLVVHEGDEGVELLRSYGDAGSVKRLSDLGITPEQIRQRSSIMTVNGTAYSCSYSTLQREWDGRENPVMRLPRRSCGLRSETARKAPSPSTMARCARWLNREARY